MSHPASHPASSASYVLMVGCSTITLPESRAEAASFAAYLACLARSKPCFSRTPEHLRHVSHKTSPIHSSFISSRSFISPTIHGDLAFNVYLSPSKKSWCCKPLQSAHRVPALPLGWLPPAKLLPGLN